MEVDLACDQEDIHFNELVEKDEKNKTLDYFKSIFKQVSPDINLERSRLAPHQIGFEPYDVYQLMHILGQAATLGLAEGSYSKQILKKVAKLADGDARTALQTLKNSAYLAEKLGEKTISSGHVEKAHNTVKGLKKSYILHRLTKHHRMLYEIIKENPQILSGKLWRLYREQCKKEKTQSIALRTYSEYIRKLIVTGLVKAERALVRGKVRAFSLA